MIGHAELSMNWRVSPHCRVVNLVRSGRKQPQLLFASAGVRLASYFKLGTAMKYIASNIYPMAVNKAKSSSAVGLNSPFISSMV
jgi:hypothetical protein